MSRLLLTGILVSFSLIVTGGILYLYQNGSNSINYQNFHGEKKDLTSFMGILHDAISFDPSGIIQFGLLVLFFVQILRVALTTWYFLKANDNLFAGLSFFILCALIIPLAWHTSSG
jgi:uncharacterized membrane protein